jgi:hypothetical protein
MEVNLLVIKLSLVTSERTWQKFLLFKLHKTKTSRSCCKIFFRWRYTSNRALELVRWKKNRLHLLLAVFVIIPGFDYLTDQPKQLWKLNQNVFHSQFLLLDYITLIDELFQCISKSFVSILKKYKLIAIILCSVTLQNKKVVGGGSILLLYLKWIDYITGGSYLVMWSINEWCGLWIEM